MASILKREVYPLIGIGEAARLLNIHKETLRRWDREGKMKAIVTSKRGDRSYKVGDVFIEYLKRLKPVKFDVDIDALRNFQPHK